MIVMREILNDGWPTQRGFRCVGTEEFLFVFVLRDPTQKVPTQAKTGLEWATPPR